MTYCNTCLLSDAYPFISFDSNGKCNCCRSTSKQIYLGKKALNEKIEKIKSDGGEYDCLIGLSGGRDSSYLALRAIKDWNLRPLAFCYNNGHMPEATKNNVTNISRTLGIKTIMFEDDVNRNRDLFRRTFNAWIKHPHLGMIQAFCIGCRGGSNSCISILRDSHNIHYVLDGSNYYEDGFYKLGLLGINQQGSNAFVGGWKKLHLQLAWRLFIEFLKNPYYMSPTIIINAAEGFSKGFCAKIDKVRPFLYEKYDVEKIMESIKNELDWKQSAYFPDPWRSDCDIALIKNYLYFKTLGFSDYDDFLSNMIRDNMIDRNEANERLQKINDHLNKSSQKIKELLKSYRVDSESLKLLENSLMD